MALERECEQDEKHEASPEDAAATLREVLQEIEDGELKASSGLVRLIQITTLALEEQAQRRHEAGAGTEPDG